MPRDGTLSVKNSHNIWGHRFCNEALRKLVRHLDGITSGVGGRFDTANFEEQAEVARKISYVIGQMRLADQGRITWSEAKDNVWVNADAAPTETDHAEAVERIAARKAVERAEDLRSAMLDVVKPVSLQRCGSHQELGRGE